MQHSTVSAPGKVILMGEHAAVYGHRALVATVELRTQVRLERCADSTTVDLDIVDLDCSEQLSWQQVFKTTDEARTNWERYAQDPSLKAMSALGSKQPSRLVQVALGESALAFSQVSQQGSENAGLKVSIRSEIPIGSGFGSSASVAVAIAGAMSHLNTGKFDHERIAQIALESERRQHGMPSGVDHMTVLKGGVLEVERQEDGQLRLGEVEAGRSLLECLDLYDTGSPAESTGWIVASVRERWARRKEKLGEVLGQISRSVDRFCSELSELSGPFDQEAVLRSIRACHRSLEELGVVPDAVAEVIRTVESLGAAAKVSGAGSLAGPGAGALLVFSPPEIAAKVRAAIGFRRLPVALGTSGLRLTPQRLEAGS